MITARLNGAEIGSETIERTILDNRDSISTPVSPDLFAQFYAPAAGFPTPAPAIIVLGGSDGGLSPYSLLTAALLASHGYATLVVAYFGDFGVLGRLPRTLENVPLEYFAKAIAWLREQPIVDSSRLGVLGFSRGGELALLLGAYYPEFSAVVSYVGSGYVMPGYDPGDPYTEDLQPAWTWGGNAVTAYPASSWSDELVPPYASTPTATPADLEAAEIPVEQINGPVLLISGESDAVWDSSTLSRVAWERLRRKEHPWPSQFLNYPGADHSIGAPYMPMAFRGGGSGTPLTNHIASVNSWAAVLNMLEWRLRQGS
jgi:dienelactone hydrolase